MTTAIAENKRGFSLAPQSLDEAMRFADSLSKSRIIPKDYQGNPGNILVAMQWGMEIGLQPLQAMQNIAVINGRPSIWGDAALAIVKGSGLLESITEEPTDEGCTCTIKRKGEEPVARSFTVADAKKAGLLNKQGPWTNYPKRMMQMRARAFALRDVFPDVLRGVGIAEEVRDIPPEKNMGQADVVAEATTKTEALKNRIAARKQDATDTLMQVLDAISKAGTLDELKKAAEIAARLTDPEEKEQARVAYAVQKAALMRAEVVDAEKATTPAAAPEQIDTVSPQFTFAEVNDRLVNAKTMDELDEAADMIALVPNPAHQDELRKVYQGLKHPGESK
ncbi:MAG: recombinase RecT [Oxalobacter formigenes]|nr:recombinase RecT [Oxalobacter formigenes]